MSNSIGSMRRPFDQVARRIAGMSETRANRQAARATDVLASVGLLALGIKVGHVHVLAALLVVMSGLLLFTLVEYCFHRWIFHGTVPFFEPGHRRHHEHPLGDQAMPFFLPPLALCGIAALCSMAMPTGVALFLTGGLATGYATYGLSHDIIHNTRFRHPLFRRWAASHHVHHFHPDSNFGVSTPIWDIVLGTRYVPKVRAKCTRRQ